MTMTKEQQNEIQYEERKSVKRRVLDYVVITIASFLYSVAVSFFLDPNSLAPGGVTGVAIILNRITGLATGTWLLIINIPILAIGTWKFGLRFIMSTMYCTAMTSLFVGNMALNGLSTNLL